MSQKNMIFYNFPSVFLFNSHLNVKFYNLNYSVVLTYANMIFKKLNIKTQQK